MEPDGPKKSETMKSSRESRSDWFRFHFCVSLRVFGIVCCTAKIISCRSEYYMIANERETLTQQNFNARALNSFSEPSRKVKSCKAILRTRGGVEIIRWRLIKIVMCMNLEKCIWWVHILHPCMKSRGQMQIFNVGKNYLPNQTKPPAFFFYFSFLL